MSGVTPGPWTVGNGGYPRGAEWEIRSADQADWYICGIPWGDDQYDVGIPRYLESRANARLIASAPDLLEPAPDAADILEQYAEFIRTSVKADDLERHPYVPLIEETAIRLRAAIARARGEV